MGSYKDVITLYMSQCTDSIDVQKITGFALDVAKMNGAVYEELAFSYMNNKKEVTKTLKYTQKNIDKLMMVESQKITGLSFAQYFIEKKINDPKLRIRFFISTKQDYPSQFSLIMDSDLVTDNLSSDVIRKVVNSIRALGFHIEYGAAFPIETKKAPVYYVMGAVSSNLTSEEKDIACALALNIRQYKSKIWDVFLFNIIKKSLVENEILESIKAIIPEDHIADEGALYIISLPLTSNEYIQDKEKLDTYREMLRQIFIRNNLIMYTGQRYPHFV